MSSGAAHPPVPGARHPGRGRRARPGLVHQPPRATALPVKGAETRTHTALSRRPARPPVNGSCARVADEPTPNRLDERGDSTGPQARHRGRAPATSCTMAVAHEAAFVIAAISTGRDSPGWSCSCLSVRTTPRSGRQASRPVPNRTSMQSGGYLRCPGTGELHSVRRSVIRRDILVCASVD